MNFEEELGEYKTVGGVCKYDDQPNLVNAPVNMWLKALDLCLDKLRIEGLDFSSVVCLSGCAQQHGSVWWRKGSDKLLDSLDPEEYLHKALLSAFSLRHSPIWMDSSTSEQCKMMEKYVGGSSKMAELTGSRAYERFTGSQIAKIFDKRPEIYKSTECITLISNFLASIFIGKYAPFDASDASGMNLMDLKTKKWSNLCLEAVLGGNKSQVEGLRDRLGCGKLEAIGDNIVDSTTAIGKISKYFVERYGFSPSCLIGSFTGDNPGSFAGLSLMKNELVISLGTSDTSCFWVESPSPKPNGHILRNPIDPDKYMGLMCYKNGSLTRERIRDQYASGDWDQFCKLLNSVPRGNFGNIGFYFDLREIHPLVEGDFRFNKQNQRVQSFSPEMEVRACLEGQFLRLFHHSQLLGLNMSAIDKILVTGGASANKGILQVVADIFHLPVYTIDMPNTACLGGAYLAKFIYKTQQKQTSNSVTSGSQVHTFETVVFSDQEQRDKNLKKAADPTPIVTLDVYQSLLERYKQLEQLIDSNN